MDVSANFPNYLQVIGLAIYLDISGNIDRLPQHIDRGRSSLFKQA